jgi:undecaprenyl-diphosphatase
MLWIHQHSTPQINRAMELITHAGDLITLGTVSVMLSAFFLIRYRRRREAITILLALGVGYGLTAFLKFIFHRDRPNLWEFIDRPEDYSFPSGHAMVSMVVYATAAYLLEAAFSKYRWAFRSVAAALIILIGLSRVFIGVHWPSDVLAGYIGGLAVLFNLIYWYTRKKASFRRLSRANGRASHSDPR